jgi:hypothetical protein
MLLEAGTDSVDGDVSAGDVAEDIEVGGVCDGVCDGAGVGAEDRMVADKLFKGILLISYPTRLMIHCSYIATVMS